MATPERLVGVCGDYLFDTLLPALRGHLGIRSGDLVALAREHGLTVPTGDPAARGPEWADLLDALAEATPLAAADGKSAALLPLVRDLIDLEEGSIAPAAWWQRLLGGSGGAGAAPADARRSRLLALLQKLLDGLDLPPDLVRPLMGRVSGALTEAETRELAALLPEIGRETWLGWGAQGVNRDIWATAYDTLAPAAQEAADRQLGLLYGTGY
jgi:hypothetical protein